MNLLLYTFPSIISVRSSSAEGVITTADTITPCALTNEAMHKVNKRHNFLIKYSHIAYRLPGFSGILFRKEKARESVLSLVPHSEAFALPCLVKRATPKPTLICKYIQTVSAQTYKYDDCSVKTYP